MFLDEVTITIRAGRGGDGGLSFRREKYITKGGPDGGNGGNGGNVILRTDANKNTLYHFSGKKLFEAEKGQAGQGQNKFGRGGSDLILDVPLGTLVIADKKVISDLSSPGQTELIARGGLGGKGNANFATSTRRTPRFAELGEPGEEKTVKLTLKLVADVGIIGLPSVGKSTLISVVSAARPKIADYPFTTLVPNLGVISHQGEAFVITDLPGLIKGASAGKGLGHRFLRHAERVRFFLHLISGDSASPVTDYRTIRNELKKYNPALAEKPEIVVISKADLLDSKTLESVRKKLAKAGGSEILTISAPIHEGIKELLDRTLQTLKKTKSESELEIGDLKLEIPVYRPHLDPRAKTFTITKKKGVYFIDGPRLSQIVAMSDLANNEAVARVQDVLGKFGVSRELGRSGAKAGAKLEIAGKKLEWWG